MEPASLYFHFSMFDLQRLISTVTMELQILGPGLQMVWILVSLVQTAGGGSSGGFVSSGVTECTKLLLDFRRLFTGS